MQHVWQFNSQESDCTKFATKFQNNSKFNDFIYIDYVTYKTQLMSGCPVSCSYSVPLLCLFFGEGGCDDSEASLRMVEPEVGFRGGTFYWPKNRWRRKKRSSLQHELAFAYQSVGFRFQKKKTKTNGVTPKRWHPGRATPTLPPSPLATPLCDVANNVNWNCEIDWYSMKRWSISRS